MEDMDWEDDSLAAVEVLVGKTLLNRTVSPKSMLNGREERMGVQFPQGSHTKNVFRFDDPGS